MNLDIIILIHNQLNITKLCLKSIKEYTKVKYRIIIVDNNSHYTSKKWINSFCKKNKIPLLYIKNKTNKGVSKGWNQGLKKSKAENIAILNNDVIVTPDWETNLILILQNLSDVLLVYPNTMQEDFTEENIIEGLKFSFGISETEMFAGYCFMLKRKCLKIIGYFDERFTPFLYEDTDYAYRLILNNTLPVKVYSSFILHFKSKTLNKIDYFDIYEANRKKLINKYKNKLKIISEILVMNKEKKTILKKINKRTILLFDSLNKVLKIQKNEEKSIKIKKRFTKLQRNNIINNMKTKKMYRVSSPINFRSDKNMEHGTSKLFDKIPNWAKDNPRLVIISEEVEVKIKKEDTEIKIKTETTTKSKKISNSKK